MKYNRRTSTFLWRSVLTLLLAFGISTTSWAQNSPTGNLEYVHGLHGSIHVKGWCKDPDNIDSRLTVAVYVKDNNNQPVEGYDTVYLTADQLLNGEDNQLHYNGYETYLFIPSAGTYTVEVIHVDATGDGSPVYTVSNVQVSAPYTVTYNANGGSGAPAQQLKGENVDLTLTTAHPTWGSNGFLCWNTSSNGGGTTYQSGGTYSGNSNVTLYAMWSASFIPGSGTQSDPYLITNTEQWNLFANNVNNGNTYNGKWVKLGADITVSTMAGRENSPFRGTFDGGGHTMNLAIDGTDVVNTVPSNDQYDLLDVAPFRHVDGATFIDLNLTGYVKATEYAQFGIGLGGLVGLVAEGHSVRILSCRSSVNVSYIFSHYLDGWGEDYTLGNMGGFIGTNAGTVVMDNCLFDGTLSGRPQYVGGFVGRQTPGTMTISNCLMNGSGSGLYGTSLAVKITFCEVPTNSQHLTMTNCYYKTTIGDAQGTYTNNSGETLRAQLGGGWIVNGSGQVVPGPATRYTITIDENIAHGTIVSSDAQSLPGATITLTAIPDQGYYGASVTYSLTPDPSPSGEGSATTLSLDYNTCTFTMPAANVTVTGTMNQSTFYTVSYDLDGGSVESDNPTIYTAQSSSFTLVNPTRDGYTFAGWTGTDISGTSLSVTVPHGSTGNRAYTATWAINSTITYILDGGTFPTPNPTVYSAMSDDITLMAPIRSGYSFAGWTGTDLTEPTANVLIPHGSTGDRTYTANWTSTSYTITYDLAGGSLPAPSGEGSGGEANPTEYTLTSPAFTLVNPTREGYTFAGWVGADINGQATTVTIPMGSVGNRSYTAIWAFNGDVSYQVYNTYTYQFNTLHTSNPTSVGTGSTWGSSDSETWYIVDNNVTVSDRIEVNGTVNLILCDGKTLTATKGIHVGVGKTLNIFSQNGGTSGTITVNGANGDNAGIGANGNGGGLGTICFHGGTVTATGGSWSAGIGGATNAGGGTVTIYGGKIHGYRQSSYYGAAGGIGSGSGGNTTNVIIAEGLCLNNEYYNERPDHMGEQSILVKLCTTVSSRTDHVFRDGRCRFCNIRQNYTVTYNANNATSGSVPTDATQYSNAGTGTATAKGNSGNLQRTGFVFVRWNTAPDGSGTSYYPGQTFPVYHDMTLYAYWAEVHPITYNLDGGQWTTVNGQSTAGPTSYNIFSDNITLANPTRQGYTFAGWTGSNGDTPQPDVVIPTGTMGALTYTANWVPIVHLAADADNTSAILEASSNPTTTVILDGYTLRRDGSWNTISLPFALGSFTGTPLEGATVKSLSTSSVTGNTLTATFDETTSTVEGTPYIVKWEPDLVLRTEDDWNAFAANVTGGTDSYEGKTVVLANDIGNTSDPVTTMVGDESHPFKGTFDGCGHTILFTKSLSHKQYLAPFRNAQNATFRNLRTRGNISTTLKFAAGLVAQSLGNCTIENCHSSIYIQSSMEDDGTNAGTYDGTHGGLIAVCRYSGSNTVRIANSLYDGTISGVVSGHQTRNCAGFVGWCEEGITLTFTNCLMAGELNVHSIASSGAFYRSNETHTLANCYHKGSQITLKQSNQTHTDAYGETLRAMLGDEWVLTSGDVFPKATNTNPIFTNVSVVNENENENTNAYVTFFGSYAPFSVGSLLPDSNNLSGNAFHGALSIHDVVPPTGYLIGNWYTDQALTTPATAIPFAASGEVTLYALYTPITYTVAFDANGGTGTMASQSFTYDAAQNLTANAFSRTGYTFAGWSTTPSLTPGPSPSGEGSEYHFADGQSVSNLSSEDGATVTLYAQWTPITYTVRFHKNDGGEDVYTDQTMTYDEPQLLTMGSFLREGYYIIGWSTTPSLTPSPSPEGEGSGYLFADGQTVSNLATGQGDVVNLYAQWNEGYRISYDLAGGQWPMVGEEQAISPTGYTAGSEPITLVNPIRYGYTFAGWTGTGLDAATMTVTIPTGSTGTRAYTATWTITTYSITYELNGGIVVDGSNVDTYTFLDESITLVNPTREGYTFEGWTGSSLTEPTTTVTIPSGSTGDRTYTANWSPTTYTITYDGLTPAPSPSGEGSGNPTSYTIETPTLTLANPTREGYTFAGWTGTGLNAATMTVTIAHGSTGDRSYTAMWTPITYTISYDGLTDPSPSGEGSGNPITYTIETPTFTLVNPTREGYTFTGWTGGLVDENGTPVPETWNSEPVTTITITTGSTGNRTYTATWTPFVYTISYDLDGGSLPAPSGEGSGGEANPTSYTIESDPITLVSPVRDGYYFVGWTGTGLATTTGSVTIPTGSTGNRSYTANWVDYGSSVPYLAYNTETGEFEQGLATIYTEVTESTTAMANGFYVVRSGHIQNYDRVTVSGTVHLILCDGADLWWAGTSGGVNVENGATIHIYGQSGGTGKLTAGSQNRDAGIGPGNVIVHGGFLDAHGSSGGAAIGGAWGSLTGGTLTVYGGKVKGSDAGDYSPISCHATIIGGTVEATHHNQAFGGNVTLGDMKVYSSADATTPVDASQRESTCHSTYVKIVPCTEHNYSNGVCTWCGHTIIQVTYNGNGATSGTVPVDTTEYESGQTATVLANTGSLERTGYTFAGWGLTPSPSPSGEGGGDLLVAGATFYISSYITLYAQWTPITYTVRFHKNDGGEEVYTDQQFTYDVAQSLTVNAFSNEDYIFVGWDTATISTITYTDGQTVSNLTDEQGAVIHLYALWVQQFYTITYDLAGGWYAGVSPAYPYPNPTTYCEFSPAITLVNPIRNDLDFVGWTGTGLDVVTMTVTIPTGSTGNRTFTANWEDKVDYIAYNTTTHNFETRSKYGDRLNVTSEMTSMTNGWYVVGSDVTISSRITVTGTVNLILRDGKTLTASEGITVSEGNTLNIYGQIGGTGTLLSTISNGVNNAGIGSVGNSSNQCGTINIHGGNVTASSGNWSAGIGGGVNMNGGTINIYGGTVNAMGHDGSSEAIGHGSSGNSSGTRAIADGLRVTVNGSPVAYGSRVSSLGNMAARIEPCTEHNMSNGSCTWCGGTICHVTYNGNGATSGTVPTDATDYMTNQTVTVLANTGNLERTGYIFAGWSLTPTPSPSGEGSADLIAAGETFTISSSVTLYARWATHQLTLSSNEDNTQAITQSSNNALHYDVTLDGYTLYRDGDWNTIVLPFDLDNFTGTPLEDATVKTLSSSSFNDGTLTINFSDDTDAIEAGKPYIVKWDNAVLGADLIIRSADEWDTFADNVTNSIETYEGMTVKLAADISVTTMVGTNGHEFKGTFDGCGHTLNITLTGSDYYVAPFSYVNGCTIKNLIVTGEVNGGMHCSGLIGGGGGSTNTSLIENCDVRVSVKCNQGSKKTHCGGFIGHSLSGSFTFRNCKFSGSISGATTYTGVFMGWAGQPATHINCLAAGTYSYSGTLVISKGTNTYTNCYTTRSIGSDCTYTTATGETLRALLGDGWEVDAGGNVVPKMVNSVNDIVNPVFYDVIIDNSIANTTTTYANFIGSYAPITDGLLDSHNPDGDALHAVLSVSEPTVSPTGYSIFAGWYIDAERTQAIAQSSNQAIVPIPFATDGSVTLYAKWDPNTYTVHFNKNNDASTGTMDDQQFTYDEAQNLIANAFTISTTGYSFGGWSTTANGEVVYSDGQSVSNLTTTNNAIVELYAKWTLINYSITYNLAGGSLPAPSGEGSGEEANPTSYNILSNPITLVNPSRTGYTFAGWTGSNGDTPETTVTIATGSTGNLTYTANWTPIPYTITFVNDDDNSTVLQSGSVNYGELPEYEGETPTKEATAQHTYTFSGWNPEIITVTGDATYTAQYTATVNEYTITFKNWDNSVLQSSDVAYGETPEYTGVTPTKEASVEYTYTFTGWSPAITTVTGSATYTAQFSQSEREYSITYYGLTPDPSPSGEGSNNPTTYTASSEAITLVNPTRTGYTFAGWTGSNGDTPETTVTIASGSTGDLTFTANWTPITYTITYDLAGGQWPTANSQQPTTYTIETPTFTLVNPERDGYYFVGWTGGVINENDNPQLTVTIPTGSTGNRSYTANWIDYGSDVPYLAYDTTSGTFETQMAQDYTEVTSSTTTMANGWYAVTSNIEISRRIEVTGTVNLILCDGKTLTVPRGMHVPSGVTLNIYGQGAGTGSIVISGSGISFGQAGIGGNDQENGGTVAIHGGIVTTTGGNRGSGIGGGEGSGHHGGSVAIYGGSVSATGGMYAAGIGGGQNGAGCTSVLITGGTVNATGNYGGAGIGGGWYGNGGDSIVITGGIVNATGGSYNSFIGAGIGGGYNGTGSTTVTFTGGTVTAIAGNSSAQAIGHGNGSSTSGTLTPLGEVKVFASADAAEPVAPNDRESTCRSSYAKLMACTEHQWVANTCSWCGATHGGVVYGRNHATGGSAPVDNTNYSNGQTVTVLGNTGNLERTGYTFAGWNTSADGTGTSYTEGNTFIFEGNTTLYAKWSAITYTISYDLNGGTVATPNPASYTANDNITLANPTKDGYSFGGWMGTGLVSPTITVTIVPGSAGNRAYTATWLPLLEYSAYNTINHEFGTLAAPSYAVVSSETTTMADGYYAVTGVTTISSRIEVTGTVHLILCDGATLTAPKGLHVPDGVTLNIYGQSAGTGILTVSGVDDYQAGIGGNDQQNGGGLYIHGGHVTVTGGYNSAGIGGGQNGNGGSFVAYGGTITANSGSFGSGIGGGYRAGCNSVNIVGGTVNATGHGGGAGIGGNSYQNGGTLYMHGGIVTAHGGYHAPGIGAGLGNGYNGGSVTIYGGSVTAYGGEYGAGIGGGEHGTGCTSLIITGGTVNATGGTGGAGIGGGDEGGNGGNVTIHGGTVTATGKSSAAGIGGGRYGGDGGTVAITDGIVIAIAGNSSAQAIGHGSSSSESGDLTLGDMKVFARANAVEPVDSTVRVNTCRTTYAKLVPCTEHNWVDNSCTLCGANNNGVVYVANGATGGTVPVDNNQYTEGSPVTVLGNTGNLERANYTFYGWNTTADGSGTTYAANTTFPFTTPVVLYAKWAINTYTITFVNHDGTELQSSQVAYGQMPVYTGATPTKATDDQYTYTFNGWSPAITTVTGDATYTAQFSETPREYTITFVNHNGTTLQSGQVAYGETPEYSGETPTKEATSQYTYTFTGWSPAITTVTGDATYTAQFTETLRQYIITFVNYDNTVLQSGSVAYGETPEYTGATPTKAADGQYFYTFSGWSPTIVAVTEDATYTAQFSETVREYTITFVNYDNTVLQSGSVAYGETPEYTGATPTKAADAQYTYSFNGWSPAITTVTGDATYTAQYTETLIPNTTVDVAFTVAGGWQAISSPVHSIELENSNFNIQNSNLTTGDYDMFRYNESEGKWENQKDGNGAVGFSTMEPGRGYIYRRSTATTLTFNGILNDETTYSIDLTANSSSDLQGFNLVGNPYPYSITLEIPFYSLNADGTWTAHNENETIEMGQAVIVHIDQNVNLIFEAAGERAYLSNPSVKSTLPPLPQIFCFGDCNHDANDAHSTHSAHSAHFAYISGDKLIIEGTGTLQVFDVLGRKILNYEIRNPKFEIHKSKFPGTGVYLLRLGGRTQKIVVK